MLCETTVTKPKVRKTQEMGDRELLSAHVGGHRSAFGVLIERHRRTLWWALRRVDIPETHRMDVFQEGLLRIHRFAGAFAGKDSASVSTWMCVIMRNTALTYMQKLRREPQPGALDVVDHYRGIPTKVHREEATVVRLDVHRCLKQLSPDLRQVMWFTEIKGMSEASTAELLGIPVGTVKSRKSRARKALQQCLVGVSEYSVSAAS